MSRRSSTPSLYLVLALLAATGCDSLFNIDHIPTADDAARDAPGDGALTNPVLVQQIVAGNPQGNGASILTFEVTPTTAGNMLVLVAAIETGNIHLNRIDDGVNNWLRGLDGVQTSDPGGQPARIEIWYAPNAQPASSVSVLFVTSTDERPIVVNFTEWSGLVGDGTLAGIHAQPFAGAPTPAASTGLVTTPARALIVGTMAYTRQAEAVLITPGYTQLQPSQLATVLGVLDQTIAYAAQPAGTYQLDWTLNPAQTWSAGVVGFTISPSGIRP